MAALVAVAGMGAACGGGGPGPGHPGVVDAVGAENQYADVIAQIGGRYVQVSSVLDDPNTDPHTFESSPSVAREVGGATLVVQNGLGYDGFMDKIEAATSRPGRTVIVAQHLLGLRDSTPNPHLWYDPRTMPAVAEAVAGALAASAPGHAAFFRANLARFDASLGPWRAAVASFRSAHPATPVATTEPVADFLLGAMGTVNRTPFRFQADVMNGVDPSAQDVTEVEGLLHRGQVKVFCYNVQVVDTLTSSMLRAARAAGIPVVALYETMPSGFDYQRWMLAEVDALRRAVVDGTSTERL